MRRRNLFTLAAGASAVVCRQAPRHIALIGMTIVGGIAGCARTPSVSDLQRSCAALQAPPGHLVYEEEPRRAAALIANDPRFARERPGPEMGEYTGSSEPVAIRQDPAWPGLRERLRTPGMTGRSATLFAGPMTSESGEPRFVVIELWRWGGPNTWISTYVMPIGRADSTWGLSSWQDIGPMGHAFSYSDATLERIQFYAGEGDRERHSLVRVPYSLGGLDGVLNARLVNGRKVALEFVDGGTIEERLTTSLFAEGRLHW